MNTSTADVLIFVEDPGAANFIVNLPEALEKINYSVVLLACGLAKDFLSKRNAKFINIHNTECVDHVFASIQPKIVLVGTASNTKSMSLSLVEKAKSVGIDSVGFIDAAMNSEKRFSGTTLDPLRYAPDWLMVPTEQIKKSYIEIGFSEEKIIVTGNPQYDYVSAYGKKIMGKHLEIRKKFFPDVLAERKILIFVTEGSARLNRYSKKKIEEFTLTGRGNGSSRTEVVIEELLQALSGFKAKPYLVLRLHPKDTPDDYKEYIDNFDCVSKGGDYLPLLAAADLVVGMTSMMMLEAALIGSQTFSILPIEEQKTWLPTISNGTTPVAVTSHEIQETLNLLLDDKSNNIINKIAVPCVPVDGAIDTMVTMISDILSVSFHESV